MAYKYKNKVLAMVREDIDAGQDMCVEDATSWPPKKKCKGRVAFKHNRVSDKSYSRFNKKANLARKKLKKDRKRLGQERDFFGNGFNYSQNSKDIKSKYKSKRELKSMEPFKTQIKNKRSNIKQGVKTALVPLALGFITSQTKLVR